jgi:hypothetical protein
MRLLLGWKRRKNDCLLPKTNPVKIPPTPPRINEPISLDVDFCLSRNTSPVGANDLVRSKVKKAPANVRTREAKKRDKA